MDIWGGLLIVAIVFAYFIPTFVAVERKHPSVGGIIVVNVFLGWLFVGWVVALAWSLSSTGAKGRHEA